MLHNIPLFIFFTVLNLSLGLDSMIAQVSLTNEQVIHIDQFLMAPQWSPNDSQLLCSGKSYKGIYIYTLNNSELNQLTNLQGSGYRPKWSPQADYILFRYKDELTNSSQFETKAVSLNGQKRTLEKDIDPFTIFTEIGIKKDTDISIKYNRQTLQVEGKFKNSDDSWLITPGKGSFYHPVLSPDKKQLLVHKKSKMFIYASDGSGLIAELGYGLGNTWSPDSKQIIFTISEDKDGHYITGAELYYTDLAGNRVQLTNTADRIEKWPDWSHKGNRIAYSDALTGELIISDIEFK